MNADTELEAWRQQWQSGTTVPLNLQERVERESRFMRIALIAEILVTVTIGGAAAGRAVRSPQPDVILLAAGTWLFIAAAWALSLTVNRGKWSPSARDTATYVELSLRRCRGRLLAIRFAACLFVVQMGFCLGWVYNYAYRQEKPFLTWLYFSSLSIDLIWLSTVAFFGFLLWYRGKKRAELVNLVRLREHMTDPAGGLGDESQPGR